jgi:DNA (cytosine-5)-methyltransferase 1
MSKKTFTSLFAGGGGSCLGAIAANLEPCESVEYDPAIAEVHKANIGGKMHVANILDCDPFKFEQVDWLHCSPVCKSYSPANADRRERQLDIDCAKKVTQFINILQPEWFSLENVASYGNPRDKKGKLTAFGHILWALQLHGYSCQYRVLTASHYGVPQSRERLILVATKGQDLPRLPVHKTQIGWYESIKHLIPDCKESKFADWQLEMSKEITKPFVMSSTEQRSSTIRYYDQPIFTIKASDRDPRARLESGQVIQLNLDCLAALQTFPKDYRFGSKVEITRKIIGNAVPPLMFSEVVKAALAPKVDLLSSMKMCNPPKLVA